MTDALFPITAAKQHRFATEKIDEVAERREFGGLYPMAGKDIAGEDAEPGDAPTAPLARPPDPGPDRPAVPPDQPARRSVSASPPGPESEADQPGGTARDPGRAPGPLLGLALARLLPVTLRGAVLAPTTRTVLVLAAVAVLAGGLAGWFAWQDRPVTLAVGERASTAGGPSGADLPGGGGSAGAGAAGEGEGAAGARSAVPAGPSPTGPAEVVVDVAGRVASPGVVRLPAGSRVVDAIERAGGVLPGTDTTGLALARVLVDGEQILVDGRPGPAPPPSAPPAPAGGGEGAGGLINLNTATAEQLDTLPGVGPVLAERIVEWREANGPFTAPEQLGEVPGFGDRRLAEVLPLVTV